MSAFSDYLEDKLLRHTLRGEPFVPPDKLYIGLFTSPTGDLDGVGSEVVGNGYVRIRVTFAEPTAGANGGTFCANDSDLRSPQPSSAPWGSISHFALFDAIAGGNRLYHGPLVSMRLIETNDLFFVAKGDLSVNLS